MGISVRLASRDDEEEQLIEILDRNLPGRPNRKIQKLRHANPLGPGWSWIARPQGSETAIAAASVLPRWFWVDGRKVLGGQVIEFAVEAPYRSLGPAVLLQRATFEPVNSGEVAFGYDCPPHERGMATFLRLGMQPTAEVLRYALLLRSDEFLDNRLGSGAWKQPLVAAANLALRLNRPRRSVHGLEICAHEKAFDEEFSHLDLCTSSSGSVRAGRAAEDLNWRYLDDPWSANGCFKTWFGRYRVVVARQAGELVAFAILSVQEETAWLADLFGRSLADFGGALLEAVVDVCRAEKIQRLDALCSMDSDLRLLLERAGFRRRERAYRVVPYENASRNPKLLDSDLQWTFTNFEVTC